MDCGSQRSGAWVPASFKVAARLHDEPKSASASPLHPAPGLGSRSTAGLRELRVPPEVRLSPVVGHAVLGAAFKSGGTLVALDDLWARRRANAGPTAGCRVMGGRFTIAEAALAQRFVAGPVVDPEFAFAGPRLVASRGRVRVERVAAQAGWSRKRLWSRFGSRIGLTPKRAAHLNRFDRAAHRLAAGRSPGIVNGGERLRRPVPPSSRSHGLHWVTPAAVAVAPVLAVDDVAWGGLPKHVAEM